MDRQTGKFLITAALVCVCVSTPKSLTAGSAKITAQKVLEELAVAHPEVTGLEMAASRSTKGRCTTIASTETKEIGEKCDKDEFTAMNTNRPFVEQEKEGFDVTVPLHDSSGKIIATLGMDFKHETGQTTALVTSKAKQIASELEKRLTSRDQLFEPAQ